MSPPRVLTIAGSDSGGGAGIQADLKTFLSLGTYGLSVLTALTAQNTTGVSAIHACPPEFVLQQLESVVSDIQIDAIKMGMLCNHDIVATLATRLREWKASTDSHGGNSVPIVLDPVMVSTSGSLLLSESAIEALIRQLLPLCTILTPNLPEARQLLTYAAKFTSYQSGPGELELAQNNENTELPQMLAAAKSIAKLGPPAVLVKGGHAQLSRSQIDSWLQSIESESKGSTQISPATRPTLASITSERYPQRNDTRSKDSSFEAAGIDEDLKQLAGIDGAIITQRGNVTVIRTDQIPFSQVLHPDGALPGDDKLVCDVLYQHNDDADGSYVLFVKPLLDSKATHGTGCTLSSALAASLAQGYTLLRSTSIAIKYVQHAIANGIEDLGKGSGPLDHSYPFQPRGLILASGTPSSETATLPLALNRSLISNSIQEWTAFVQHPFVLGLADGTLARDAFEWFMKQDYLFLRHYARIWAQAAASPDNTFEEVSTLAEMARAMAEEAKLHLRLCQESFGISANELEHETMESAATLTYTRYVLDTARSGDSLDLLVAVSPCMVGYAQVGLWLAQHRKENIHKDYAAWIEAYSSDDFQRVVQRAMRLVEAKAARDAPSSHRLCQLQKTWNAACRLEAGMWDEAVDASLRRLVLEP